MPMTIDHPETGAPSAVFARAVFARAVGSYTDVMCRAATRAAWLAAAKSNGLIDPDGHPLPGVYLDEIGPITVTKAVFDDSGAEVTPADIDHRHHVNARFGPEHPWQALVLKWMEQGNDDAAQNSAEETRTLAKVSIIDPDTIRSPVRVWA